MKKQVFRVGSDGFKGAWYPAPGGSRRGLIIMLGDSSEDSMAKTGAKWLNEQGIHAMAMSPDKKDYGHHRDDGAAGSLLLSGAVTHHSDFTS